MACPLEVPAWRCRDRPASRERKLRCEQYPPKIDGEHIFDAWQIFDAVVVASGHYHTPLVPDIPGLAEAKSQWPVEIAHSKSFRNAEGFEGKVNLSSKMNVEW
jgi:hypothetical protein